MKRCSYWGKPVSVLRGWGLALSASIAANAQETVPAQRSGGYLSWIFLILVIVLVFFLVRSRTPYRGAVRAKREELLAELDRRYERGELSKVEYDRRKAAVR